MNLQRLFNTIKHLRLIQLRYQLRYRLVSPLRLSRYKRRYESQRITPIVFREEPPVKASLVSENTFVFLNQTMAFGAAINWDYQGYGKLWNYNLQYGTFLLQSNLSRSKALVLLRSLYSWLEQGRLPLEPYPVSLRVMNVIRWLSRKPDADPGILPALHAELDFLSGRLEYHLLGNHLMENGFALLMGGAFFSNPKWEHKGRTLLEKQLNEQILSDGAHYELSTSYHNIILFRVLELIDWYGSWYDRVDSFSELLKEKAALMLSWIGQMQFNNGDIPHFNDSTEGMAFPTTWLLNYASKLNVHSAGVSLGASGYRSVNRLPYECRVDVAPLGAEYQPGHAHADALSFILHYKDQPLLVHRGTSTYQPGRIRDTERSTAAHNTVVVEGQNSSQMWSQFRVARRAHTTILMETPIQITAQHNGYKTLGVRHQRTFNFGVEEVILTDELLGPKTPLGELHLHFQPHRRISLVNNLLLVDDRVRFSFSGLETIRIESFDMAIEFNQYMTSQKVVVGFRKKLITKISLPS